LLDLILLPSHGDNGDISDILQACAATAAV
jgi:hypothetical protein